MIPDVATFFTFSDYARSALTEEEKAAGKAADKVEKKEETEETEEKTAAATDAEKAEWRKANGIPEKPEDYAVPEVKGYEWTEADKPLMGAFMASTFGPLCHVISSIFTWCVARLKTLLGIASCEATNKSKPR